MTNKFLPFTSPSLSDETKFHPSICFEYQSGANTLAHFYPGQDKEQCGLYTSLRLTQSMAYVKMQRDLGWSFFIYLQLFCHDDQGLGPYLPTDDDRKDKERAFSSTGGDGAIEGFSSGSGSVILGSQERELVVSRQAYRSCRRHSRRLFLLFFCRSSNMSSQP